MIKIDIFSGFLGAGKTTLIKKLISEGYKGEKLVLIENEFGEIGIDGGFLQDAGITVNEMNSGCICCSLVGDFAKALEQVISQYSPDRIVIEPSLVADLIAFLIQLRQCVVSIAVDLCLADQLELAFIAFFVGQGVVFDLFHFGFGNHVLIVCHNSLRLCLIVDIILHNFYRFVNR